MSISLILTGLNVVKGFFVKNPNKINTVIIYAVIAGVAGLFWLDYRGAKKDVIELKNDLTIERQTNETFKGAIEDFEAAEAERAKLVAAVDRLRISTEKEIAEVRADLDAPRIRELAIEDDEEATAVVNGQLNDAFSLFDDATNGD